jgi:lantibiotic modifying enzyme
MEELTLDERRQIRLFQKEKQLEFATNLLNHLMEDFVELEEMDPMDLLDALGCQGLSLTIGNDASNTFIKLLAKAEA